MSDVIFCTRALVLPTYSAHGENAGAADRLHGALWNPADSGRVIRLRQLWAHVAGTTGNSVLIAFELARLSDYSGGSEVTPVAWDTADAAPAGRYVSLPSAVSDAGRLRLWMEQINALAAPDAICIRFDAPEAQPPTLRPGEGLYLKQRTSATPTFTVGMLWTEE